jgi:hypothetical protein
MSMYLYDAADWTIADITALVASHLADLDGYGSTDNLRTAAMYCPKAMSPATWVAACVANGVKPGTARNRLSEVRRMQADLDT